MSRTPVNLDAIAEKAGVSRATVHRALRNKDRVSERTRRLVLEVARDLGYRPNLRARGLVEKRSATLGVLLVGMDSFWTSYVVDGIEEAAQAHQYALLLAHSRENPERERDLSELLLAQGVDGLIVMPAHPRANSGYFSKVGVEGIPVVLIDRFIEGADVDFVATDNLRGGYMATQHLIDTGRRHIAHLARSWGPDVPTSMRARWEGYLAAMEEAALPTLPVLTDTSPHAEMQETQGLAEYLDQGGRLDGICAAVDGVAASAIRLLAARGLRVPEDVGVVGFNDSEIATLTTPNLTTVRQPMREIGQEAVRLVFSRLHHEDGQLPPRRLLLAPTLVVRESSGICRAR